MSMRKDGIATREKILDGARDLVLKLGYSGMKIDHVLEHVGLTKGAFFHHFKTKEDLAKALLRRYAEQDALIYAETREQAEKLSDDPLQQILIFIRLFEDMFSELTEPYPGCLLASYVYELQQFDDETRSLLHQTFARWRTLLQEKFELIIRKYPPQTPVSASQLADGFTVVLEGAFILAKAMNDARMASEQLRLYRNYIELLFAAPAQMRTAA
jgi:TetR/AcrR family transcriptional regulator, transcriptional repressor for nem operon